MKKLFLLLLLAVFSVSAAFAQTDSQSFLKQSIDLYKSGNLDSAIASSEKAVDAADKRQPKDFAQKAMALGVSATLHTEKMKKMMAEISSKLSQDELIKKGLQIRETGAAAEERYRDAINIYTKELKTESVQSAALKGELAWLMNNYVPPPKRSFNQIAVSRSRVDEVEILLAEALQANRKLLGENHPSTLNNYLETGKFYLKYSNFEKAEEFLLKYLETVEKSKGKENAEYYAGLTEYSRVLVSTDRIEESKKIAETISQKTGKVLPEISLNLIFRSKDGIAAYRTPQNLSYLEPVRGLVSDLNDNLNYRRLYYMENREKSVSVPVKVSVKTDAKGKVIEAKGNGASDEINKKAEKEVSQWNFRPFNSDKASGKLSGYVIYIHRSRD